MNATLFCILTILYTIFGIIFYEFRFFTYIDESIAFAIAGYGVFRMIVGKEPKNKPFIIWLSIATFYLCYSLLIKSNVNIAIFNDFVMQVKPYMVLFGMMSLKPKLKSLHWLLLQIFSAFCTIVLILVYAYYYNRLNLGITVPGVILSGEAFSACAILIGALFYLSCNDSESFVIKLTTLLIMMLGMLVPTSKYIGIFICTFAILFFVNKPLKINFKYLTVGIIAIIAIGWLVKDEFIFYFIEDYEYNARPMLYMTMPKILNDYFPFGSGLGTFANAASAIWYSPLYEKYDLDMIWGLAEGEALFVSDTYYPTLAQFGYVGVALFIWFIAHIFHKMNEIYYNMHDLKRYRVALIIIAYTLIEATSNSFINERCILAMVILALSLYKFESKHKVSELDTFGLKFIQYTHKNKVNKLTNSSDA